MDTKEVFRGRNFKVNRKYTSQTERTTIEKKFSKTLHIKLKTEQHKANKNQWINLGAKYYSQNYRYHLAEDIRTA